MASLAADPSLVPESLGAIVRPSAQRLRTGTVAIRRQRPLSVHRSVVAGRPRCRVCPIEHHRNSVSRAASLGA